MKKSEALLLEGAEKNNLSKVLLALNLGADINTIFKNKERALHIASHHNTLEVAELLMKAGASVDIKDSYGKTALDYVCSKK